MTSLVLIFPLFLFYQVGVLAWPKMINGADLITRGLIHLLHQSFELYGLVNAGLLLVFVVVVLLLRKYQRFSLKMFVPVVIESSIYAVAMGVLIIQVMGWLGINPSMFIAAATAVEALPKNTLIRIAFACGAGVHEEILFRLILLTGTLWLLHRLFGVRRWLAILLAVVLTSLLFSAAHHVVGGEPWRVGAFVFRFFVGLILATLFQLRGLAVAVYTHALYDVLVFVIVRG